MSTSKEFTQIANQLPVLAKLYFNHLHGTPTEIARQQNELLKYLKGLHQQLCVKGTRMVRIVKPGSGKPKKAGSGKRRNLLDDVDFTCPGSMHQCPGGGCVGDSAHCNAEAAVLGGTAAPPKAVKKAAPAKSKSGASKKKK